MSAAFASGTEGQERVDLDEFEIAAPADDDEDLLAMHDALDRFAASEPEKAECAFSWVCRWKSRPAPWVFP